MRTSTPAARKAAGNAPATSPRPPVFTQGAISGVTNSTFMEYAAFPPGRPKERRHAPEAQPARPPDPEHPQIFERSEDAGFPPRGGAGGGGPSFPAGGDQPGGRAVESFGSGVADHGQQSVGKLLAVFHAPLVEGIDMPEDAEGEHLVL